MDVCHGMWDKFIVTCISSFSIYWTLYNNNISDKIILGYVQTSTMIKISYIH